MFTGLVEELGRVVGMKKQSQGKTLTISAKTILEDIKVGDSIAVNGACLTVVDVSKDTFWAGLGPETLAKTNLSELKEKDVVNLERALKVSDRLGGHFMTGHIDGVGTVLEKLRKGETVYLRIEAPPSVLPYLIPQGSISVDGVSLTVAEIRSSSFVVSLIPYTLGKTTLGRKNVGSKVNLEADLIVKCVEKLYRGEESKKMLEEFLKGGS